MRHRHAGGWTWFGLAAAAGTLVFAGVAVAKHVAASTATVTATFSATTVPERKTKTCTGADGTYEVTHARYTGTAVSGDTRLDGAIELRVRSVYNTNENLGWLRAHLIVLDPSGKVEAHAKLDAVNANGQLEGLLEGHVRDPHGKVLGNVSAAYTSAGGFASGAIGSGNAANTAIVFDGDCHPPKPAWHEKGEKRDKPGKAWKAKHKRR